MTQALSAKPFLKWAGGKRQLLDAIAVRLPSGLHDGTITRYVEPFVGSGAVFFHLTQAYRFEETLLMDANEELVLTWQVVRDAVESLIDRLKTMQKHYLARDEAQRKALFLETREAFNADRPAYNFKRPPKGGVNRAAQVIFLNRTCFNGLFRVNSRALFNVPFGKYESPRICNAENLLTVSKLLQGVRIECGDFERAANFIDENTFVYLDPPYRPISRTASFNSYAAGTFGDAEQRRLAGFCRDINTRGAKLLLSNSDPCNETPDDDFFDRLYDGFTIERVSATRLINSVSSKRGVITEILVRNYK